MGALVDQLLRWWRENAAILEQYSDRGYIEAVPHLAFMGSLQKVVNGSRGPVDPSTGAHLRPARRPDLGGASVVQRARARRPPPAPARGMRQGSGAERPDHRRRPADQEHASQREDQHRDEPFATQGPELGEGVWPVPAGASFAWAVPQPLVGAGQAPRPDQHDPWRRAQRPGVGEPDGRERGEEPERKAQEDRPEEDESEGLEGGAPAWCRRRWISIASGGGAGGEESGEAGEGSGNALCVILPEVIIYRYIYPKYGWRAGPAPPPSWALRCEEGGVAGWTVYLETKVFKNRHRKR